LAITSAARAKLADIVKFKTHAVVAVTSGIRQPLLALVAPIAAHPHRQRRKDGGATQIDPADALV
jgi:hypothetical protein